MEQSRILVCAYRKWALDAANSISSQFEDDFSFYVAKSRNQFRDYAKHFPSFDLVFFVGWSWIVPKKFVDKENCICLHPSPLPKYRGGSPIQNQIISGETHSCLTAFVLDHGLDSGPLCAAVPISLQGNLSEVLGGISRASVAVMSEVVNSYLKEGSVTSIPQDEDEATHFSRRKPNESEILPGDFTICTSMELHNKIRSLQDPYPNAYVRCADGKKLFILQSKIEE